MADGLTELMNCRVGVSGMSICPDVRRIHYAAASNLGVYDWGWADPAHRQSYTDYCAKGMPTTDPTLIAIARIAGPLVCRRRCDLVEDAEWLASPHYRDYFRHWGIGDFIYSLSRPAPESGVVSHWINLGRDASKPPFSVRDRRRLFVFAREMRAELGRALAPFSIGGVPKLAPRLIQVLELLRQASSEKQIAAELGLSPHTVHGYVKQLYRHFGVSSRAELLTRSELRGRQAPGGRGLSGEA